MPEILFSALRGVLAGVILAGAAVLGMGAFALQRMRADETPERMQPRDAVPGVPAPGDAGAVGGRAAGGADAMRGPVAGPPMPAASAWRVCPTCPLGENEWPVEEFYAGMARCKACYSAQKKLAQELKAFPAGERARIRKRRGVCQECPNPVGGVVGKSLYCAACSKRLRAERERKHRRRADVRERRHARRRALHRERMATDPVYAAQYRLRRQKETLFSCPYRVKSMETQRRHNADPARQERKRAHALARYYEQHPERPSPVCATCSQPIPYAGKGKPPKYHQTPECNPHRRTPAGAR